MECEIPENNENVDYTNTILGQFKFQKSDSSQKELKSAARKKRQEEIFNKSIEEKENKELFSRKSSEKKRKTPRNREMEEEEMPPPKSETKRFIVNEKSV